MAIHSWGKNVLDEGFPLLCKILWKKRQHLPSLKLSLISKGYWKIPWFFSKYFSCDLFLTKHRKCHLWRAQGLFINASSASGTKMSGLLQKGFLAQPFSVRAQRYRGIPGLFLLLSALLGTRFYPRKHSILFPQHRCVWLRESLCTTPAEIPVKAAKCCWKSWSCPLMAFVGIKGSFVNGPESFSWARSNKRNGRTVNPKKWSCWISSSCSMTH